jgi:hypothetical protein
MTVRLDVASALYQYRTSLEKFVDEEIQQSKTLINPYIDAATDLSCTITHMELAFEKANVLDQLVEEVDSVTRHRLNFIRGELEELRQREPLYLPNLASCVRALTPTLNLPAGYPQVTGMTHRYVFVVNDGFKVTFVGAFDQALAAGKTHLIVDKQTSKCELEITPHAVAAKVTGLSNDMYPQGAMHNTHFLKLTLQVPYLAGKVKQASFSMWTGVFPLSPGEISLTYPKLQVVKVHEQHFRTGNITLSRPSEVPGPIHFSRMTRPLLDGWKVKGAPTLHIGGETLQLPKENYSPDAIHVEPELTEKDSECTYHLEFDATKEDVEMKPHTEKVALKWGKKFSFTAESFEVEMVSHFDGKAYKFIGDGGTPHLTIHTGPDKRRTITAVNSASA